MVMNDMTDDGKWGAAIYVDGVKPDWLGENCKVDVQSHPGGHWYSERASGLGVGTKHIGWRHVEYIRLPADHPHYQQTEAIDWSAPIEAVHEDGRVVPARIDGPMERSRGWKVTYNDGDSDWSWCVSNEGVTMAVTSWRIRNVQPAPQTPGQTLTAQERLARMEALVRRMAGNSSIGEPYEEDCAITHSSEHYYEARALVAEMVPVDPLEAVIEEAMRSGNAVTAFEIASAIRNAGLAS